MNWEKLRSSAYDQHSKISILNLWMNKKKLRPNLISLLRVRFQPKHSAWDISITSNLRSYIRIDKICFPLGKEDFKSIGNSAHTTYFLTLGKTLNIYIDYLMFYSSRHVKKLHWAMVSWWTVSYIYIKFNVFSVIRNDFGHVPICC